MARLPVPRPELTGGELGDRRRSRPRSSGCSRRSATAGHAATSSAARSATCMLGRVAGRLGPGHRRAARSGSSSSSPAPSTRTASGRSPSATAPRRYEITTFRTRPRLRRLPPTAPGGVRRHDRARTWPGATSPSTRWPGADGRASRSELVDPYDGRADLARGDPPGGRRPGRRGSARTPCGWSGPSRLAATLEFTIEPATLDGDRAAGPSWSATCRASGSRSSSRSCSRRRRRRSGCARSRSTGLLALDLAGAGRPARDPPEQDAPARTSGTTPSGPSTPRRPTARSSGSPPSSTTSASRRRSPTVASSATRRSGPGWPTTCSAGCASRGRPPSGSSSSSGTTCSRTSRRWGDAAIRRFIAKIGRARPRRALRAARGRQRRQRAARPTRTGSTELRGRVADQLAAEVALDRRDLAVDGDDLIGELGLEPGPRLGAILDRPARGGHRGPGPQRPPDAPPAGPAQLAAEPRSD